MAFDREQTKTPVEISGMRNYRLIPSHFPPIQLFEHLLDPEELEVAYALEALTNDRLRDEAGDIALVEPHDRMVGPGSSAIMAAFTHAGYASRFTDGSFGVYYAGLSIETAIAETVFHREKFLGATNEPPCQITMRSYISQTQKPLLDVRSQDYSHLYDPTNYQPSQAFAKRVREQDVWGLVYESVRRQDTHCIAIFRPTGLTPAKQGSHYQYHWDGRRISDVLKIEKVKY
ncbi:RES family NAD+ phosphorylase [Algicola sagamiensis]|uniref:RES family NAD+ phosphorylase n=1 Tax=Algicola sagamiensis TaxID=163869 RepID=UPI0003A7FD9D|nr:RES family NAD+ phosphorylase [Algicola sagamiensis]